MTTVESTELRESLAAELDKADRVIQVLMAHVASLPQAGGDLPNRVAADLAACGLSGHQTSRWQLLREANR